MEMRDALISTLIDLVEKDKNILVMDADLGAASRFSKMHDIYPDNFVNVGIAEANLMGIAAGLSLIEKTPVVHTFAPFASRRCFDQIYLSGGYARLNIKIFGSDPGICAAHNGGTHTTFEDIALYRMIPNSKIYDPADENQLSWLINRIIYEPGIHYIRSNRKQMPLIYSKHDKFELEKIKKVIEGTDILLIASGEMLYTSIEVAKKMFEEGISTAVVDLFNIKPIDKTGIINELQNKNMVVTLENHSLNNGIGSMVAEIMAENQIMTKLLRIGIDEEFGQVGSIEFLRKAYKLDQKSVYEKIMKHYKDYLNNKGAENE